MQQQEEARRRQHHRLAVVKAASKGKQVDGNKDAALARFDQLDSDIKGLNEKLTKLEAIPEEGIHGLRSTLESKINPGSVMNAGNLEQSLFPT